MSHAVQFISSTYLIHLRGLQSLAAEVAAPRAFQNGHSLDTLLVVLLHMLLFNCMLLSCVLFSCM
jgi:hypothetical protein